MEKRKRFYVALAVYAVLGLLIWTVMSDVPVPVPMRSGHVSIRALTLMVLALFVMRTLLHWRAEQIRTGPDDKEEVSN
jgi:uncharacterized membrane protein YeiB